MRILAEVGIAGATVADVARRVRHQPAKHLPVAPRRAEKRDRGCRCAAFPCRRGGAGGERGRPRHRRRRAGRDRPAQRPDPASSRRRARLCTGVEK
ncbi:hypothetical protein [Caenispirillum salinarum]|uniref:hypothetical protein n=1 Tax=Caenispirillum salinarum TaxID=859058 RepID=UPI0038992D30